MKHVDEYRDGATAKLLAQRIASRTMDREYRLMEFCGGHTHAIFRYGLSDLLPSSIRLIHGPGCPVCVLPMGRIDGAIFLSKQKEVILATYADMMRVPASNGASLYKARAEGADVRMVYSAMDALQIASENRGKEVVFFAIGFETTTPPTALAIMQAKSEGLRNFSVYCNHVLTPPALMGILDSGAEIDGVIGPSHVSAVIGTSPYDFVPEQYGKPVVIAGFEPLDVMQSISMLVDQINSGAAAVENEYSRAVDAKGNLKAQALIEDVFELRDSFEWRGLGWMGKSARKIAQAYSHFDAEIRFDIPVTSAPDHKACECGEILRGIKRPKDCRVFGTACTPENPLGSCMVSSEGACAAYYSYGRYK